MLIFSGVGIGIGALLTKNTEKDGVEERLEDRQETDDNASEERNTDVETGSQDVQELIDDCIFDSWKRISEDTVKYCRGNNLPILTLEKGELTDEVYEWSKSEEGRQYLGDMYGGFINRNGEYCSSMPFERRDKYNDEYLAEKELCVSRYR